MSMFTTGDILETIEMFTQDNLDVRKMCIRDSRKTDCPEFFQHIPAPCSIYCTARCTVQRKRFNQ